MFTAVSLRLTLRLAEHGVPAVILVSSAAVYQYVVVFGRRVGGATILPALFGLWGGGAGG